MDAPSILFPVSQLRPSRRCFAVRAGPRPHLSPPAPWSGEPPCPLCLRVEAVASGL